MCQAEVRVGSGIQVTDDRFVNKIGYFVLWFCGTGVLVTKLGGRVAADACLLSERCFLSSEVAWWQKGLQGEESD